MNSSPWLEQIDSQYGFQSPQVSTSSDIVVLGAGIAGVCTAYYILKNTDFTVTLVEGNKIAHGASGHNAGQVVQYFERSFASIAEEYGLQKAVDAQCAVQKGWQMLEEMVEELKGAVQFEQFIGYAGVQSREQLLNHLENKFLRDSAGVQFDGILVDREWLKKNPIPAHYSHLIEPVTSEYIKDRLETSEYFPILLASKKGCINSALLCQKLVQYMMRLYPTRLTVFEHTHVSEVRIFDNLVELVHKGIRLVGQHVILCTNGFENFRIVDLSNEDSQKTNTQFHTSVEGLVGYMVGYYQEEYKNPTAISFFVNELESETGEESYFYMTRRTVHDGRKKNLICVGGPELFLSDTNSYIPEKHDPKTAYMQIRNFLRKYVTHQIPKSFSHQWHGIMGFTDTRLRYIGQHPETKRLWYNLGCNGVGIVTSVYGGWKIAELLRGVVFEESVFDPFHFEKEKITHSRVWK